MKSNRKIIVLTPVKNEAWILHPFLATCSVFADHIIIADQQSTDGSLEIYPKYPKVILVENSNPDFNESERQLLLLNKARELYGTNNVLLAIDADEILAGNAMETQDWEKMTKARPGTILYFEKPSLYKDTSTVIRFHHGGWPLGYVDDGAQHYPQKIHSTRIPTPEYAEKMYLEQIKFIHYNTVRLGAFYSKLRFYIILENIHASKNLRNRLRMYDRNVDVLGIGDAVEKSRKEWFEKWDIIGINVHYFPEKTYYWYDFEALKLLGKYGCGRFAFDDIWDFDWESLRKYAEQSGFKEAPKNKIRRPFPFFGKSVEFSVKMLNRIWLFLKQGYTIYEKKKS